MGLIKMLDNDNKIVRLTSSILNMDIILNTSTDNIVVFHHNDADGKLSAQLVYETLKLKHTKRFISCNYDNAKPKESMARKSDIVFIVDYCIPMEELAPIVAKAKMVVFIDHHKTALTMVMNNYTYFEEQVKNGKIFVDIDMNKCGAKIVSDYFYNYEGLKWNLETVKLVDLYDRRKGNDLRADYLNQFIYNSSMSYIGSEVWNRLLYDEDYLKAAIEVGRQFYDFNVVKNKLIYDNFSKEVEFHGLKMSVIEGYGNLLLFGDKSGEYDACCVYHRTPTGKWKYSLYTDKPDPKLHEIAELYGGGGHPAACGFTVDERVF